jgi:hypothetical protein
MLFFLDLRSTTATITCCSLKLEMIRMVAEGRREEFLEFWNRNSISLSLSLAWEMWSVPEVLFKWEGPPWVESFLEMIVSRRMLSSLSMLSIWKSLSGCRAEDQMLRFPERHLEAKYLFPTF